MKKSRTKIYIKIHPEENKIIYSGIEFHEFIRFLPKPMENLILIKGDYIGNKYAHNFEILEGVEEIEKLLKEDIYSFGNFCFADYAVTDTVNELSDQQIAELLYIAHMIQPLSSPFFSTLQNRFIYLAHDDGWYCKLYCKEILDFIPVLLGKIISRFKMPVAVYPDDISKRLLKLATDGLLIDLEEVNCIKGSTLEVKLYTVGDYSDMDYVLNNFEQLKAGALHINYMYFMIIEEGSLN